jgi:hypothetical protein
MHKDKALEYISTRKERILVFFYSYWQITLSLTYASSNISILIECIIKLRAENLAHCITQQKNYTVK